MDVFVTASPKLEATVVFLQYVQEAGLQVLLTRGLFPHKDLSLLVVSIRYDSHMDSMKLKLARKNFQEGVHVFDLLTLGYGLGGITGDNKSYRL